MLQYPNSDIVNESHIIFQAEDNIIPYPITFYLIIKKTNIFMLPIT
jgi:hypothetical protein